jgi:hypothetical protein
MTTCHGAYKEGNMSTQNNQENFASELDNKMWITKGARFNAHERLMSKHKWSITTVSFLSGYVIIVSLFEYLKPIQMNSNQTNLMSFLAVALAIFILVISLLEASKSYERKAVEQHDCGRKISTLYAKLRQLRTSGVELSNPVLFQQECGLISSEYERVLNECPENHDVIDNDLFRAKHPEKFKFTWSKRIEINVGVWFSTWLIYATLIVLFPVAITFLLLFT